MISRATKKAMREGYARIISVGYGGMQALLSHQTPIAYSAGVYGWACDYYSVNGVLISTGYAPLAGTVAAPYELVQAYERQAKAVQGDYSKTWEAQRDEINGLLYELVGKLTEEVGRRG